MTGTRDGRTVDIVRALIAGLLVAVVPSVLLWCVGLALGADGAPWTSVQRVVFWTSIAGGTVASVLVLRRRRGSGRPGFGAAGFRRPGAPGRRARSGRVSPRRRTG